MMQEDSLVLFEPVPTLSTKWCKFLALVLKLILQYTVFIIPLIVWYKFDILLAFFSLVLTFIIMGIIRSKLRNDSIPLNQREFHYNDDEIVRWFLAKQVC
ncbi:MAG: hypothetical protein RBR59_05810 [Sulfurimonadaceae bacterium]|jgi:hypothetical protein|nr:hypothetical protein [Sulfurimonadaceae bacterium]